MKKNTLFEECLESVPNHIDIEIDLSFDIANRIDKILKSKGLSQKDFAKMLGKKESEVSKWLQGTHNFTIRTLAKISDVLNESVIEVTAARHEHDSKLVYALWPGITYERIKICHDKKMKDIVDSNLLYC